MNKVKNSILNTITYGDIFNFPLKAGEIHRFLISSVPATAEEITNNTKELCSQNLVEEKNGLYFLPGRKAFIQERMRRENVTQEKVNGAKKIIKLFSCLPSVKMVGLTGDLSYDNGQAGSDVDLMVVTSAGRLWLTRLLVFLFLKILGRKMNGEKNSANTNICINVWCDVNNLAIPEVEQDLVLASDISHLIPLVNKENTYEKFISGNLWLKNYFSNWKY